MTVRGAAQVMAQQHAKQELQCITSMAAMLCWIHLLAAWWQ